MLASMLLLDSIVGVVENSSTEMMRLCSHELISFAVITEATIIVLKRLTQNESFNEYIQSGLSIKMSNAPQIDDRHVV